MTVDSHLKVKGETNDERDDYTQYIYIYVTCYIRNILEMD